MKLGRQFGGWLCGLGLSAALLLPCAAAARQHPQKDRPPKAEHQDRNDRPPTANAPRSNNNGRVTSPNGQERWRNMTPQEKQKVLQNAPRFRSLSPAQQQELRNRAQVWQRMTPEQRDHIRNDVLPKWRQMPQDRKQAIQQRLHVLQNMPEYARNQRLNDPNFTRGMSEEDKGTLRDLSHLHVGGAPDAPNE